MSHSTLTQKTIHFGQYPIVVDILSHHENQHTLIILPALGVSINKYEKLTALLAENGFNVVIADYPHCGRNQPLVSKGIDYGYAELLNDFIPQLEQLAIEINGLRPILFGHSLGGHLATLYAQHHDNKVIGIATGNIGLNNWDFKGKFNILKATAVINAMILKDGFFAGYKIAFGNRETKTLMQDWSKVVFSGNYKHVINSEKIVENDALFIYLQGDDFAPMSSMLGLSGYFKQPKIKTLDLTQHVKGNQHSAWLKQPDDVVKLIKKWVENDFL